MGWAVFIVGVAAFGFLFGVPCGIAGLFSPRWRRAAFGIGLSLAPWFIGLGMLHLAAAIRGFHISP
jgi:hypothetical protein